ncbi:hypothetical protein [Grimontia sp. NTOU-MAR1]|uniref:hypothetical protein n=1 Tax=Grimontia sp. NTOU-MAR1 TaxID=3111011 RepID=UPI002DB87B2B|nr:hypothetical protein [Grimontia sp. NTOU-MAR1]WRV97869.1 hypothetical protein VP504_17900 [Grimontia sp. NTOU-MAR1]
MDNVVETVRFKLKEGTDVNAFLAAAEGTLPYISGCKGFVYRSLSFDEQSQEWTDIVYWTNLANAQAASENFMNDEGARKMVSHIDSATLVMAHQGVRMSAMGECIESA